MLINKLRLPECIIRRHFRIYCPACGGTRAFTALLEGDIAQSLHYNPIIVLFILDLLTMVSCHIYEKKYNRKYITAWIRIITNMLFLMFIIAYSIVRNYLLLAKGIDMLGDFTG